MSKETGLGIKSTVSTLIIIRCDKTLAHANRAVFYLKAIEKRKHKVKYGLIIWV